MAKEFNVDMMTIKEFLAKKGFQIDPEPNARLTIAMYKLLVKEYHFSIRLSEAAKELNVGKTIIREFLAKNGFQIDSLRNDKLTKEMYSLLVKQYHGEKAIENDIDFVSVTKPTNEEGKGEKEKEKLEKHLRDTERKKATKKFKRKEREKSKEMWVEANSKIEYRVPFSALTFGQGLISITYNKKRYVYTDHSIRDYDKILEQIYSKLPKDRKRPIKTTLVRVIIDTKTETFTFKDIDIRNYVNRLKNIFLPENTTNIFLPEKNSVKTLSERPSKSKGVPLTQSSISKTITLGTSNIHFYNGYYIIFQTNNGEVDNSVTPYRVNDPNSHEILNLVHSYFERKLEQLNIIVQLDKTTILEPSKIDQFQLSNYVRFLNQNLDEKGGWWKEVQNYRKPSLKQCRSISAEVVKKKVSLKNGYLDSLVSMQSEIKLIPVYEINNHGKKEDAFIFSINMPNNRRAVIFENVSNDAATATWIFVTKIENYETCIKLVFDYFTNYTLSTKRFSLRAKTVNPPEKFKAENYIFIDHDDLKQWLKKLNKILEQTPEPSEIQFVPGLHIPKSSETREGHNEAIATKNLHNQLIRKLYDKLCSQHGEANVGTENRVGRKRIDVVAKGDGYYDIYEVKTAENAYDCVQEALGQLFIYTALSCHNNIRKMVVVGMSEAPKEFEHYLTTFRKNHSLQLYYMKV